MDLMGEDRGIYATLCFPAICNMAWLVSFVIPPCMRLEGLLPSRRRHNPASSAIWSTGYQQFWLLAPRAKHRPPATMRERIRGKPKRGSPWRPRKPSLSPSTSPITGSSTHPPILSPGATPLPAQTKRRRPSATVPPQQSQLPHAMASIPRGTPTTPRCPPDPRMQFFASMSFPASSSTWRSEPRAFGAAKRLCLHQATHPDSEHLRDRLGILYDLVFELRREVADLKFRLQSTEDNVATFLQILSTMQMDLSSDPTGITPGGEIDTELDDMLRQAAER
jgi:hypothetical protein